jgi:hypothetical protein
VTVSDGTYSDSQEFNITILPLEDGDDMTHVGDIKVIEDENGTTTTLSISDELLLEIEENTDGTVSHRVVVNGKESNATTSVTPASVEFLELGVQTTAEIDDPSNAGYVIKAIVVTKVNGEAITKFVRVSKTDPNDIEVLANTLITSDAFTSGNNVNIEMIDGILYFKVKSPLDQALEVE